MVIKVMKEDSSVMSFPLGRVFPSIITLVAICAGLTSIRCSVIGKWEEAVIFIVVAAFLDAMDGRVARLLGCSSLFGAQLDSIADFLNFGVAPALLLYFWRFAGIKVFGWSAVMMFVICMAIRLAKFNTKLSLNSSNNNIPKWQKHFFYGVPAPSAAGLSLLPVMLSLGDFNVTNHPVVNANLIFYVVIVAILAVSNVPTFAIKNLSVRKSFIPLVLALFGSVVVGLIVKPWVTLPVIAFLYILCLPMSLCAYCYMSLNDKKNPKP